MALSFESCPPICINEWFEWAGFHPFHYNCLDCPELQLDFGYCNYYWNQYNWQHGPSIEEIGALLAECYQIVCNFLETSITPHCFTDDITIFSNYMIEKPPTYHMYSSLIFETQKKLIVDFNCPTEEFINTVNLTYLDEDSDGFFEVAQVILELTLFQNNLPDIILYFPGYNGDEHYLICPVDWTYTDTQAIGRIDAWHLINPELYRPKSFLNKKAIDACDLDNYVQQIDIYEKVRNDCLPDGKLFYYDSSDKCLNPSCKPEELPICARIIDKCEGKFSILLGDTDEDGCFIPDKCPPCIIPERLCITYEAGLPDDCVNPAKTALFKLVTSKLQSGRCDCPCVQDIINRYAQETSVTVKNEGITWSYPNALRNMSVSAGFGTTVGALEAFQTLQNIKEQLCYYTGC